MLNQFSQYLKSLGFTNDEIVASGAEVLEQLYLDMRAQALGKKPDMPQN